MEPASSATPPLPSQPEAADQGGARKQSGPSVAEEEPAPVGGPGARRKVLPFLYSVSSHLCRPWEGGPPTERQPTGTKLTHPGTEARPPCSFRPTTLPSCTVPRGLLSPQLFEPRLPSCWCPLPPPESRVTASHSTRPHSCLPQLKQRTSLVVCLTTAR